MDTRSLTTIGDLHEGIVIHILSFLPTFDAIRASAVCRKWRNIWHSVPVLNFDIHPFARGIGNQPHPEVCLLFAEFISQTLFLRQPLSSPPHRFALKFDYNNYGRRKSHVDSWIRYAINSNVVELDLDFDARVDNSTERAEGNPGGNEEGDDEEYQVCPFHFSDLINSSVQVLKLHGCDLHFSNSTISIASLKSITLIVGPSSSINSEDVSKMTSLCVNIEYLSIDCRFLTSFKNLKIVSSKLKELILSGCKDTGTDENSVEICAPSLVSITFDHFFMGKYIFRDISSLVAARLYFNARSFWQFACWSNLVISLTKVRRLCMTNMYIWFEVEKTDDHSMHDNDEVQEKPSQSENHMEYFAEGGERLLGRVPLAENVFSDRFVFKKLKHLELLTGYTRCDLFGLECLLEICPRLEFLVLDYHYPTNNDGNLAEEIGNTPVTFHMRTLKEVKMKNYRGTERELYVVELLKRYKRVLKKIVAYPARSSPPKPDEPYFSYIVLY